MKSSMMSFLRAFKSSCTVGRVVECRGRVIKVQFPSFLGGPHSTLMVKLMDQLESNAESDAESNGHI